MQITPAASQGATRKHHRAGRAPAPALQHPTILRRLALPELARGPGRAHAPIVWLCLASHLRWSGPAIVWPSNDRIATCTGLSLRAVERGIAYLRQIGKLTITRGLRPATRGMRRRRVGRLLQLHLLGDGPIPIVRFPSSRIMAGVWRRCAAVRARPAALVAVAVAEYVLAAAESGDDVTEATPVNSPISLVRALVGAAHGSTFHRRLADLERAGLLERVGVHWRSGAVVQLPPRAEPRPLPSLEAGPLQRVTQPPAANGGPTLAEIVALDAEIATALRWRPRATG